MSIAPHPIKVVPMRLEAVAPVAQPRLTYRGGPLLTSVEAFLFFWGEAWQQQPDLVEKISGFFDYVVASPLVDQLAEYGVQDFAIGRGKRTGAIALGSSRPAPVAAAAVSDAIVAPT